MKTFGIIGVGNMGYPILCGAVKAYGKDNVKFYERTGSKAKDFQEKTGALACETLKELVTDCEMILLAVKPQVFKGVCEQIAPFVKKETVIISVAAGVTIDDISSYLDGHKLIVRTMPNTPALVNEGMTAVAYSDKSLLSERQVNLVEKLFSSFGKFAEIPEKLINVSVCASGSSPAYVYMFIEAMADGVVKYGLPRNLAYEMVAQTVLGAAKMVLETKEHPGLLKDKVCSPGGTTIEGVSALEEFGFRNAIIKACDACYEKNNKLVK